MTTPWRDDQVDMDVAGGTCPVSWSVGRVESLGWFVCLLTTRYHGHLPLALALD